MRTKTLVAIIACLMLLCSCALAEDVTLQFWHHYSAQSAENATLMNVLIPEFEAENPGIKVNAVSHEWAELHDKVLVSAKSGTLPDVARCDIAWAAGIPEDGHPDRARRGDGVTLTTVAALRCFPVRCPPRSSRSVIMRWR